MAWDHPAPLCGQLPAVEFDGEVFVESLEIMKMLDAAFPDHGSRMVPDDDTPAAALASEQLQLERELVLRPSLPATGRS